MKNKMKSIKMKNIPVYEHLEYYVKHTTYAQRLRWLQEINERVWSLKKMKIIHFKSLKLRKE